MENFDYKEFLKWALTAAITIDSHGKEFDSSLHEMLYVGFMCKLLLD